MVMPRQTHRIQAWGVCTIHLQRGLGKSLSSFEYPPYSLQNRDNNTLLHKVASIKSALQRTAYSIITTTTIRERRANISHQDNRAEWRVRDRRPEPGRGLNSSPASASPGLPPTSAGTQQCVLCVLTSRACPCPAAEETPRSAANAPARS